ncbi:MAG: helix-turn-helix domain-containing protein [Prevotella sp.]|nr:helix-turn-helix domain-containing protein [Prevotella sp.]
MRYLMVEEQQQVLLAATTEGLIVSRLEPQADRMIFRLHQREADRTQSLSSSGMMDIIKAHNGRLYVSTESGGVNLIEDADLLKEQLTFRHYTVQNHMLPSDVVMSMAPMPNGRCAIVSSHLVSIVDSTTQYRQLDTHYFNADYRFSEARPLMVDNDTWIFGLNDGAFLTTTHQMERQTYQPQMVLTCLEVRGESSEVRGEKQVSEWWNIERMDTLTLQPHERNITLHFAAIDYQAPERISYAFRLMTDGQRDTTQWNYIGTNRSVTLLNLEPGTYRLEVRSTNADGVWMDNQRVLTLIVKPTFWEAWYGKLLLVLLIAGFVAAVIYTLLYIRRIKRQHRETLEKYQSLIEVSGKRSQVSGERSEVSGEESQDSGENLDPMLQRVMQFVEENIANSDVNVGDMASAAAVSRSGLQRKVKQAMGITPQDLLHEARIKRACQLLRQTDKTVAEVAYACGFSDPKYFSRSFKQSTGLSPTEYKTQA